MQASTVESVVINPLCTLFSLLGVCWLLFMWSAFHLGMSVSVSMQCWHGLHQYRATVRTTENNETPVLVYLVQSKSIWREILLPSENNNFPYWWQCHSTVGSIATSVILQQYTNYSTPITLTMVLHGGLRTTWDSVCSSLMWVCPMLASIIATVYANLNINKNQNSNTMIVLH